MKNTKKKQPTSSVRIRQPKRQPGYFILTIKNKQISNLSKQELLEKYFINLDKNLKKDTDLEMLIKQYEKTWKKLGKVQYIDSWGHKWEQGVSHNAMLEYLQNKQQNVTE